MRQRALGNGQGASDVGLVGVSLVCGDAGSSKVWPEENHRTNLKDGGFCGAGETESGSGEGPGARSIWFRRPGGIHSLSFGTIFDHLDEVGDGDPTFEAQRKELAMHS